MDFSVRSKKNKILKVLISILGVLLLLVIIALALYISFRGSLPPLERAERILTDAPLIDGYNGFPMSVRYIAQNDLGLFNLSRNLSEVHPWSQSGTDIPRLRAGKVGAQIWSAYAECDAQHKDAVVITLEQIDLIKRMVDKYSDDLEVVTDSEGILKAVEKGKIGSLIAVAGGHSIQYSLAVLRSYYDLGVRVLALTSHCSVPWAKSYSFESFNRNVKLNVTPGLTNFGKDVIHEMNRLGMIIDVSHASIPTMKDAIMFSKAPVIFSRSAAKHVCDSDVNVPDDVLRFIRHHDGLLMINFFPDYINCQNKATIKDVIRQLNHIRNRTSIDSIGIGSGFSDMDRQVDGLNDVSRFPYLFEELIKSGNWSDDDLEKLAGKNFLRVFQAVEEKRDELKGINPYQTWITKSEIKNFTNVSCSGTSLPSANAMK